MTDFSQPAGRAAVKSGYTVSTRKKIRFMKKLREQHTYEGNPVGLPKKTAEKIAAELDRHLASFIILHQQYHKHHWMVEGPQFRDLHLFFEGNYTQIHEAYDALAERLTVMGLTPTCHPNNLVKIAYVEHEEEGVFHVRDMLSRDMEAEKTAAIELRKSIKVAFEHDDFATKSLLEGILKDTEDRAHHIEHFLGHDSVSVGMLHDEKELAD